MGFNSETSAALVYLILYVVLFGFLVVGYILRYLSWRSRYTVILFHVTIRMASQAAGLAFGLVGYANTSLLVAYFILGAEGYFTLVICAYRFLIDWHYHNLASHDSWLECRHPPGTPFYIRMRDSFILFGSKRQPMNIIHTLLIGANVVIIVGGSELAGISQDNNIAQVNATLHRAKILRAVGQSIFLSINLFLLFCILDAIRQCRRERSGREGKQKIHPTLWILLLVWPLLCVRGIYGILAGVLPAFNYFNPNNYGPVGLKDSFVISEYILSTTMEWTSCSLLMFTFFTSYNDPPLEPLAESNDEPGKLKMEEKNAAA